MSASELRSELETLRETLRNAPSRAIRSSENGPIGISIIDKIVAVMEDQERRIEQLEQKLGSGPSGR